MTNYMVQANFTVTKDSLQEARLVAQMLDAVRKTADTIGGGIRIIEGNTLQSHAIVEPTFDRSTVVAGRQESTATVQAVMKQLGATFDTSAWDISEVEKEVHETGSVNYSLFVGLIEQHEPSVNATEVITEIVGKIAANNLARELRSTKR